MPSRSVPALKCVREGEVAGLRDADAGGDEWRDLGRHDADRGLAHGEARILGADRHVRDAENAEAARDGVAFDRRDHDLRRGVHHLEEGAVFAVVQRDRVLLARARLLAHALFHVLEIGAGAEGAAGPAQDHGLDVTPFAQVLEHRAQLADQHWVERVLDLRPVERDVEPRALAPQQERLVLRSELRHGIPHQFFSARGRVPIILEMICSITSSAPPPIEARRESRNARAVGESQR